MEIIKETRDTGAKHRKCTPMGRLIYDIHVVRKHVESVEFYKELEVEIDISLDARNMRNMNLIPEVTILPGALDKTYVISIRLIVEGFTAFDSMDFP